jgi:hypothetical protein
MVCTKIHLVSSWLLLALYSCSFEIGQQYPREYFNTQNVALPADCTAADIIDRYEFPIRRTKTPMGEATNPGPDRVSVLYTDFAASTYCTSGRFCSCERWHRVQILLHCLPPRPPWRPICSVYIIQIVLNDLRGSSIVDRKLCGRFGHLMKLWSPQTWIC